MNIPNRQTKLLLAFDIGHTTGITLALATFAPFWHIEYVSGFEHVFYEGLGISIPGPFVDVLNVVDEVWVEYPRLNDFSRGRAKTAEVIVEWRTLFANVATEINEVLPSTWKNSSVRGVSLQSWVYLAKSGRRLSKHELDAFGMLYWRSKQLYLEHKKVAR